MTQEQDEKLNTAHQEFERLKANEIKREIEKARQNWDEELAMIVEQAKQTAVANAKNVWLKEQEDEMSNAREEDLGKALTSARQEWEKEKVIINIWSLLIWDDHHISRVDLRHMKEECLNLLDFL